MLKTVAEVKGIYNKDLREIIRIVEERGFLVLAESGNVLDGECETLKILKVPEMNHRKSV